MRFISANRPDMVLLLENDQIQFCDFEYQPQCKERRFCDTLLSVFRKADNKQYNCGQGGRGMFFCEIIFATIVLLDSSICSHYSPLQGDFRRKIYSNSTLLNVTSFFFCLSTHFFLRISLSPLDSLTSYLYLYQEMGAFFTDLK